MAIQMWREKGITAGVYRNQQQGLISASSDDKNLGASVVYNEGDAIRSFKNESVTPDDTQTVLYQNNNDDSHTRMSR